MLGIPEKPLFFFDSSLSLLHQSTTCFRIFLISTAVVLPFLLISSAARDGTSIMAEFSRSHEPVPQEADDNGNANSPTSMECVFGSGGEEDASEENSSDLEEPISFSEDGMSEISIDIFELFDCRDVGCTWPCAHHIHPLPYMHHWYPDFEGIRYWYPQIPTSFDSEMKDCQFCRILFSIGQNDCYCGANARNEHIPKSGGCRRGRAECYFRLDGQLTYIAMSWECGSAIYELGFPTGKVVGLVTLRPF